MSKYVLVAVMGTVLGSMGCGSVSVTVDGGTSADSGGSGGSGADTGNTSLGGGGPIAAGTTVRGTISSTDTGANPFDRTVNGDLWTTDLVMGSTYAIKMRRTANYPAEQNTMDPFLRMFVGNRPVANDDSGLRVSANFPGDTAPGNSCMVYVATDNGPHSILTTRFPERLPTSGEEATNAAASPPRVLHYELRVEMVPEGTLPSQACAAF